MDSRKRILWIDVAKFIGIFAIYLGHLGPSAGKSYLYVFSFHVPLFFFLSGCLVSRSKSVRMKEYFLKKFRSLMVPFYLFVLLSVVIASVQQDLGVRQIVKMIVWGGESKVLSETIFLPVLCGF